jgi:hypothetical protein
LALNLNQFDDDAIRKIKEDHRRLASMQPRPKRGRRNRGGGGGIGDHFQIVRGVAIDDVRPNTSTFRMTVQKPLEQFSSNPGATIRVVNSPANLSVNAGGIVWAIYNAGAASLEETEPDGTLTERTDDDTAAITVTDDPHGILVGQTVDVAWSGGNERTGMTVTDVDGQDVTLDGGTGDNLPAESTAVDLTVAAETVDWEAMKTPFGHIPEFAAKITVAGSASGDPPGGGPGTVEGTVYRMLPDGIGGTAYESLDFDNFLPVGSGITTTPVIFNPFPYPPGPGLYPVEFLGAGPGTIMGETYVFFSLTGFDLTGHGNYVAGDDQVLVHEASSPPEWKDAGEFAVIIGDIIIDQEIIVSGDTVSEGYCIDLIGTGPKVIHVDMITGNPAIPAVGRDLTKQQFWIHFASAANPNDAKWQTADFYNGTAVCQSLFHFEGDWRWATLQSYSATEFQLFVNDNDDFDFKTLIGYTAMNHQVIWHENGVWKALDIPETGIKLLGSDAGTLQFFDAGDFVCPE